VENFGVGSSVHKKEKLRKYCVLKKILLKKEAVKVGTE
jgi:hypothetical protein